MLWSFGNHGEGLFFVGPSVGLPDRKWRGGLSADSHVHLLHPAHLHRVLHRSLSICHTGGSTSSPEVPGRKLDRAARSEDKPTGTPLLKQFCTKPVRVCALVVSPTWRPRLRGRFLSATEPGSFLGGGGGVRPPFPLPSNQLQSIPTRPIHKQFPSVVPGITPQHVQPKVLAWTPI